VINRYHKFVKPAFEEFIKPTRKFADVIIPRGSENRAAIKLVANHLIYQLGKAYPGKTNIITPNSLFTTINEIIDPKHQFYHNKIRVTRDNSQVETLKQIFEDFIKDADKTSIYSSLFIDLMMNNLLTIFTNNEERVEKHDLVFTELDDSLKLEFKDYKTIAYFQTSILTESDLEMPL
jgi:hypothetical protein